MIATGMYLISVLPFSMIMNGKKVDYEFTK